MTAYNNQAYPNKLFHIAVTIRCNWINHKSSKHDRNKKQIIVTHGGFYCRKLLFSGIIHTPFVTNMLERQQIMIWNWYVVFRVLSLLESGNFRWKPTWLVHTTQANIDRMTFKMAVGALWVVTEPKNSNMTLRVTWACVGLWSYYSRINPIIRLSGAEGQPDCITLGRHFYLHHVYICTCNSCLWQGSTPRIHIHTVRIILMHMMDNDGQHFIGRKSCILVLFRSPI